MFAFKATAPASLCGSLENTRREETFSKCQENHIHTQKKPGRSRFLGVDAYIDIREYEISETSTHI